jgi:polyribonucleotide nucleotidyltransferase
LAVLASAIYKKPEQNEAIRQRVNEVAREKMLELSKGNLKKADRKERYEAIKDELYAF